MVRYVIASVVGCLYVAGSIWLVRSEGQAYRDGLTPIAPAVSAVDTASPAPSEEKNKSAPAVAEREVDVPRQETAVTKPAHEPARKPPKKTAVSPGSPSTELAKATDTTAPSKKQAVADPAGKTPTGNPLASHSFWSQPQLTKDWGVAHLSLDDERRMRDELHEVIIGFNPLVEDPSPWLSRVEDVAEPLLKTLHRKEIKYKFFILNSDVVNAFSIPGGNVYISRGLFDLIAEDEDYALQFAIGHEIAHVDLEHAIKCLRDPGVMKMTEGTLQKLFMLILPFGYLESDAGDQEFEADDWVANRMQRIGRTRREILVFLQKLEGYSKTHGFYEGRVKPQPSRGDLSPLENHYRAQTAPRKRLKHLKEFIDQAAKTAK
jgi:hypothetical protein